MRFFAKITQRKNLIEKCDSRFKKVRKAFLDTILYVKNVCWLSAGGGGVRPKGQQGGKKLPILASADTWMTPKGLRVWPHMRASRLNKHTEGPCA